MTNNLELRWNWDWIMLQSDALNVNAALHTSDGGRWGGGILFKVRLTELPEGTHESLTALAR